MSDDAFIAVAEEWDRHPGRCRIADEFVAEVERLISFNPQQVVLELGCGTGLVGLRFASRTKSMLMLDTSESMLAVLNRKIRSNGLGNVQVIAAPVQEAGLSAGTLDAVFSSMALHHMDDLQEVLCSVKDLLKPGGQFVIGELLPEDGSFHADEAVPHNGFDPALLGEMLESSGFAVNRHYENGIINKPGKDGRLRHYGKFVLEACRK